MVYKQAYYEFVMMKEKAMSLISGNANGYSWRITMRVLKNGSFKTRGTLAGKNNKEDYQKYKSKYKESAMIWGKNNHEKTNHSAKLYRLRHKEEIQKRQKQYCETHIEKVKERHRKYRENNQEKIKTYNKYYNQLKIAKVANKRCKARHRHLGFVPINEYFEGAEAHHLNKKLVVYIPKESHHSFYHSIQSGKNMQMMNIKAIQFVLDSKRNV